MIEDGGAEECVLVVSAKTARTMGESAESSKALWALTDHQRSLFEREQATCTIKMIHSQALSVVRVRSITNPTALWHQ
jgi:hypothetical protein